jgi:DNA-binding MarR family transcriptional regulator
MAVCLHSKIDLLLERRMGREGGRIYYLSLFLSLSQFILLSIIYCMYALSTNADIAGHLAH